MANFQLVEWVNGGPVEFPLVLVSPGNENKIRSMVYVPYLGPVLISSISDYVTIPCFIQEEFLEKAKNELITSGIREAAILGLKYKSRNDSLVIVLQNGKYGIACLSLDCLAYGNE
jgi:hypothetical protein